MKHFLIKQLCISAIVLLTTFVAYAQLKEGELQKDSKGNAWYNHLIRKGETLYGISRAYQVSVEDIRNFNPGLGDELKTGDKLRIPYHEQESTSESNATAYRFLIHEVKRKETLYGLSKQYHISVADIIKFNPVVKSGMQTGQRLKIPIAIETEQEARQDTLSVHIVRKGETLYGISRMYGVSIEAIKACNGGLPEGLSAGERIKIPSSLQQHHASEFPVEDSAQAFIDSSIKKTFDIALLLPFYTGINDSINKIKRQRKKQGIYPPSSIAIQFYEGVLLALDSMKKRGASVRLFVYDTENDSVSLNRILSKEEMQTMDLIIGPLYKEHFLKTAAFARMHHIPVVSPVPQSNRVLLGNPWVSKVAASVPVQMEELGRYVATSYSNERLMIINTDDEKDRSSFERIKSSCNAGLQSVQNKSQDSLLEYHMSSVTEQKIKQLLSENNINVILLPSSNQVLVTDFLTKLHKVKKDREVIVFGKNDWFGYDNLDVSYLHGLHVHLPASYLLDYDEEHIRALLYSFRERFKTEPNRFCFLGFDILCYYLNGLMKYGKDLQENLPNHPGRGVSLRFRFFKTSPESGLENRAVSIQTYQDFKLIEVN